MRTVGCLVGALAVVSAGVMCDATLPGIQLCPDGTACDSNVLDCSKGLQQCDCESKIHFCDSTVANQICKDGTPCSPDVLDCSGGLNKCKCGTKAAGVDVASVEFCDSTVPDQMCQDGTPCNAQWLDCSLGAKSCKCKIGFKWTPTKDITTMPGLTSIPPKMEPVLPSQPTVLGPIATKDDEGSGWWWQGDDTLAKEKGSKDEFEMLDEMQKMTNERQALREMEQKQQQQQQQKQQQQQQQFNSQPDMQQQWQQPQHKKKLSKFDRPYYCDSTADKPQQCHDGTPCSSEYLDCDTKGPRRCICGTQAGHDNLDYNNVQQQQWQKEQPQQQQQWEPQQQQQRQPQQQQQRQPQQQQWEPQQQQQRQPQQQQQWEPQGKERASLVDIDEEESSKWTAAKSNTKPVSTTSIRWWNKPGKQVYCDSTNEIPQTCADGTPCSPMHLDCTTKGPRRCICGSTSHEYTGTALDVDTVTGVDQRQQQGQRQKFQPFPNMPFPSGPSLKEIPTFKGSHFTVQKGFSDISTGFDLYDWLKQNKMTKYEDMFREEDLVTEEAIKELTDEQLEEMGIPKQHSRDRVMKAVTKLKNQGPMFESGFNVRSWLSSLGMVEYEPKFKEANLITVTSLQRLNDKKLRDIGIDQIGSRNRLITAARGLATQKQGPAAFVGGSVPFTQLQQNLQQVRQQMSPKQVSARAPQLPEEWKEVGDRLAQFFPSLPRETLESSVLSSKGDGERALALIVQSTGLSPQPFTERIQQASQEMEWNQPQRQQMRQQLQQELAAMQQPQQQQQQPQQQHRMQKQFNEMMKQQQLGQSLQQPRKQQRMARPDQKTMKRFADSPPSLP